MAYLILYGTKQFTDKKFLALKTYHEVHCEYTQCVGRLHLQVAKL